MKDLFYTVNKSSRSAVSKGAWVYKKTEISGAAMTVKINVKALSGKKLFLIHNDVKLSFFKSFF